MQAAMAVVELTFVFYYSLGVWHFVITEARWAMISAVDKLMVGFLLAVSVHFLAHSFITKDGWFLQLA